LLAGAIFVRGILGGCCEGVRRGKEREKI